MTAGTTMDGTVEKLSRVRHSLLLPLLLSLMVTQTGCIKLPEGYDPSMRPNMGAVADYVRVSMKLLSIRDIKSDSNEITVDVLLEKQWSDARLAGLTKREVIWSTKQPNVWLPDLYVGNSVSVKRPEENSVSLRLSPDGSLSQRERLAVTLSCAMTFGKFPFDNHDCDLMLSSYSYTNIHQDLVWHGMVNEDAPVFDSEYTLTGLMQNARNLRVKEGEYVRLTLTLSLSRSGLRYFIRALLPAIVFSLISYGTLYIEERRGGKIKWNASQLNLISLAVNSLMLTLLVFVGQINSLGIPRTATITGFDVWMIWNGLIVLSCFGLKFLKVIRSGEEAFHESSRLHDESPLTELSQKRDLTEPFLSKIERYLRITLPVVVVLYVVIFFAVYLS